METFREKMFHRLCCSLISEPVCRNVGFRRHLVATEQHMRHKAINLHWETLNMSMWFPLWGGMLTLRQTTVARRRRERSNTSRNDNKHTSEKRALSLIQNDFPGILTCFTCKAAYTRRTSCSSFEAPAILRTNQILVLLSFYGGWQSTLRRITAT